MYNGGKIIIGLIIFLALAAFPFYAKTGKPVEKPAELTAGTDDMHIGDVPLNHIRAEHMKILDRWRDEVVRGGERFTVFEDMEIEKSIQKGCLECHSKSESCDKCHTYAGVKLYCWGCHFTKEEGQE